MYKIFKGQKNSLGFMIAIFFYYIVITGMFQPLTWPSSRQWQ